MRREDVAVNAAADAVTQALAGGQLHILAASGAILASLGFSDPAFGPAVKGQARAYSLTPEASAPATGRAVAFRALTRTGAPVWHGTVGPRDADLIITNPEISEGAEVSAASLTYIEPHDVSDQA